MLENIRTSLRGIWSHKLRSLLTVLGVIIGIASIIAIVSIVEGTNQKLEKNLIGAGNNVTTVSLTQDDWYFDPSSGLPAGVPMISETDLEQIRALPGAEAATAYVSRQAWNAVFYLDRPLSNGTVFGVDSAFFDTMLYRVSRGRDFTAEEYQTGRKVAILSQTAAETLFMGEDPLGQIIEIQQEPFLVVGVISSSTEDEQEEYQSINDYYMYGYESQMGQVYIPQQAWPIIYQFDEPRSVGVRVTDTKDMVSVGKRAADLLNASVTNGSIHYAASNSQEFADDLKTLTNAIRLMLVSIASLSLLVGGIGVMNIMLVSVTERTAEIGLKKALGAKRRTILAQFLTESAVLTSAGGILGVIVGIGLAKLISVVANLPFGISVPWLLIAVGFSMAIGLVFGAMPARRAAKLDPIEALRRE
ncbi:MAG: ABC transporter permease [Firmicutes bacterium]|nr:ABC transporter permease [Bacillota bacterium]